MQVHSCLDDIWREKITDSIILFSSTEDIWSPWRWQSIFRYDQDELGIRSHIRTLERDKNMTFLYICLINKLNRRREKYHQKSNLKNSTSTVSAGICCNIGSLQGLHRLESSFLYHWPVTIWYETSSERMVPVSAKNTHFSSTILSQIFL